MGMDHCNYELVQLYPPVDLELEVVDCGLERGLGDVDTRTLAVFLVVERE
jgi:hypothetical protein